MFGIYQLRLFLFLGQEKDPENGEQGENNGGEKPYLKVIARKSRNKAHEGRSCGAAQIPREGKQGEETEEKAEGEAQA